MVVGVLKVNLLLFDIHSLKEKRSVVKRLIAMVRNRLKISCAEVGANDLHQRTELAMTAVSSNEQMVEQILSEAYEILYQSGLVEIIDQEEEMIRL